CPVVLADLVDLHNVRVLKTGDGQRLRAEARQLRIADEVTRQDHLQGHHAVELGLPGLVDDRHTPAAQLPQDLVPRDPGAPGRARSRLLGGWPMVRGFIHQITPVAPTQLAAPSRPYSASTRSVGL